MNMNSPVNFNFVAFSESRIKSHQQSSFADYIPPPESTSHHITEVSRSSQTCPPGFVGIHNFPSANCKISARLIARF